MFVQEKYLRDGLWDFLELHIQRQVLGNTLHYSNQSRTPSFYGAPLIRVGPNKIQREAPQVLENNNFLISTIVRGRFWVAYLDLKLLDDMGIWRQFLILQLFSNTFINCKQPLLHLHCNFSAKASFANYSLKIVGDHPQILVCETRIVGVEGTTSNLPPF